MQSHAAVGSVAATPEHHDRHLHPIVRFAVDDLEL